jgi:NAD(P)H-hydrate epimerase
VKQEIYPLISVRTTPEIMVKCVSDYCEVLRENLDVLAIGPGLGRENEDEILEVIASAETPAVLDADALNMIARRGFDCLEKNSVPRLLTPHPGEFARLAERASAWKNMSRRVAAEAFAAKFSHAALLLKGARTVIAAAGKPTAFNTTGNPGMATGGVGDVLTGVCAALIAQGLDVYDAACLGSWINGRAAELALLDGTASAESLSSGLIVEQLGAAFDDLRKG